MALAVQGILDKEKIFCDTLRFLFSQHSVIPEEIKNTTKIFFFHETNPQCHQFNRECMILAILLKLTFYYSKI